VHSNDDSLTPADLVLRFINDVRVMLPP
jgi:hypothetical protein